ncbi:uncharacterized protein PGTG_09450 [Puccinia graminis f. sp. tritici CRL 75-36-700-3]|uniref:Myb/SANT-like domain-containing protein n=1 Tax=Puccinia graminis f. sp. tritici (strain CRL 75-36-700-3 / race SCCL) TaxID=418459 RepID=E3KHG2_PUCGT|nr:uncharacterized protein PGTG_09450 [Puccinia graminis f. sp. tritici CRL 75-36-700-3]EFP83737.2 hypothetical protein PGTG_09450 [Puccinia graminis f. sp. tritici CRL 75-36-700-3]
MARGRRGRPSQPETPSATQTTSPSATQTTSPSATQRTTNSQGTASTQQSPTPNLGTQVARPLAQVSDGSFPDVEEGNGPGKVIWTQAMEKSALDLYVRAVQMGKRSDSGFKIEVHRWVASELSAEYPGIPFTGEKVISKFNQTFKKWYDAFLACKDASGFGWNDEHNMVTASDEVWEPFLVSHPAARRFKNAPFPEFHELFIIFGGHAATGVLRRGLDGEGNPGNEEAGGNRGPIGHNDPSSNEEADPSGTNLRPGVRPRRRHRVTSGDRFENSIERLIDAFTATSDPAPASMAVATRVERAISKFQDSFAEGLPLDDLVAGFSILEVECKAQTFLAIRDENHARAWIVHQIELHHMTHNA